MNDVEQRRIYFKVGNTVRLRTDKNQYHSYLCVGQRVHSAPSGNGIKKRRQVKLQRLTNQKDVETDSRWYFEKDLTNPDKCFIHPNTLTTWDELITSIKSAWIPPIHES